MASFELFVCWQLAILFLFNLTSFEIFQRIWGFGVFPTTYYHFDSRCTQRTHAKLGSGRVWWPVFFCFHDYHMLEIREQRMHAPRRYAMRPWTSWFVGRKIAFWDGTCHEFPCWGFLLDGVEESWPRLRAWVGFASEETRHRESAEKD